MKLLLLDYISYPGHQNFNKIHIEALLKSGHELDLLGRKEQFNNIEQHSRIKISEIPDCFFKQYPFPAISFRIKGIITLRWVKRHVHWEDYDAVIVLTYDILSLFSFYIKQPTYLINHNNVQQLWSRVKLYFTRNLPHNYIHIALNIDMENRLKELLPHRYVYHVPHGICSPSSNVVRPHFFKSDSIFLFCPINRNFDSSFVTSVFESDELIDYLSKKNLPLYVKVSLGIRCNHPLIRLVPSDINAKEYNYMVQQAAVVILPYNNDFKYRCSGIFFECVASNTPIVTTKLDSMAIYKQDVNMKMFSNAVELINAIDFYLNNNRSSNNLNAFNPKLYWDIVLRSVVD